MEPTLKKRKIKTCCVENCTKYARGKTDKCKGHGGGRRCMEKGCKKASIDKTNRCIAHGGGRRCTEVGCNTSAVSKSNKCVKHGGGVRCSESGCNKSARSKSDKCAAHGGGVRCMIQGCSKAATNKKTNKCALHGGGRRCSEEDCVKLASGKTDKCKQHGGGRRCIIDGCTKSAREQSNKCARHGGGKRCEENGCNNLAKQKSTKCGTHGGGLRCPNCADWIDSRGGCKKYDNYCATCFKRIFPNDPRSKVIYEHTKEIRVRNFINKHFDGFIHDKPIYTNNCDCTSRRRIDHRKIINGTMLAIETDEFAHKKYDQIDEEIRYDDLFMNHSGKYIYIRFNPDGGNIDIHDKLKVLRDCIDTQIRRIENDENKDLVEIIKLFY